MLKRILATLASGLGALLLSGPALAKPPVEAFKPRADIHDMTLSPDGKRVAWVQTTAEGDGIAERDLETGKVTPIVRADGREIIGLRYLTDKHLHFLAMRPQYNAQSKDVYNIATAHIHNLARAATYRFDGYGEILAVTSDDKRVFMLSGWQGMEIMLDTGNVWSSNVGRQWENDFVIDASGTLRAAQDIDRETGLNKIFAANGTDRRVLFEEGPKPAEVHLLGLMPDGLSVAVEDRRDGARAMRALSLADGKLSDPVLAVAGAEMLAPFRDRWGGIAGAAITGLYPRYEFFDAELAKDVRSVRASFPGQAVRLVNWSDDKTKLLVHVEGGIEPGRYAIFDRAARRLVSLMQTRPAIAKEDMGEVVTIEYPARDGQKIGAIVTWPARVPADQRKKLPMVVMPNETPDAYESVGFDWVAQFLANEGYVVFQPNYRGSGGQGAAFRQAGHDQFGRTMQHDVTDGIHALGKMGWIDEDRVCIYGHGWAGYMALTGAAITPQRYRCVATYGAVTDLPDFLKRRMEGDQRYNDYVGRWKALLGDPEGNWDNQQRYSPVNLARQFMAPALLVHADFDNFSPDRQSRKMEQALEAYQKPVRHMRFDREDEYLIMPANRHLLLNELASFFAEHTKPRPAPPPSAPTP